MDIVLYVFWLEQNGAYAYASAYFILFFWVCRMFGFEVVEVVLNTIRILAAITF